MTVYIVGVKASKKDLERLNQDLQKGFVKIIEIKRTPKNNINIIVED